jgi:hypothetical protein
MILEKPATVGSVVERLSEVQPKTPRIKELKALGLTDSSSKALKLIGETKAKQSFKSFFKSSPGQKKKRGGSKAPSSTGWNNKVANRSGSTSYLLAGSYSSMK